MANNCCLYNTGVMMGRSNFGIAIPAAIVAVAKAVGAILAIAVPAGVTIYQYKKQAEIAKINKQAQDASYRAAQIIYQQQAEEKRKQMLILGGVAMGALALTKGG